MRSLAPSAAVVVLLALVVACSDPVPAPGNSTTPSTSASQTPTPNPTSSPTTIPALGPVTFKVCSIDHVWTRPSEQEMEATAWRDPRWRDVPIETRRELLGAHFYRYIGSSSLSEPWIQQTGLGQYPPDNTGECGTAREMDLAASRDAVEVWTLLYEPIEVDRTADGFVIRVRPLAQGFRAIQFGSASTYVLPVQIVDETGEPLECLGPSTTGGRCR